MPTEEISVIVTVRNGRAYIREQLESVVGQNSECGWEVIVIDNGSSDGTLEIAAEFAGRLPGLRLLSEPRTGKAYALNRAMEAARGSLLVFLDHDDELSEGYLEAMRRGLQRYDLVGARVDRDALNPPWARFQGGQIDGLCTKRGRPDFSIGAALGARAEVARAVHFDPDVGVGEDIDFCWRAQDLGFTLGFVPDAVLRYRQRTTEKAAFRQGYSYGLAEVRMYMRYRRDGYTRPSTRVVLWTAKSLLRLLLRSFQKSERMRLCYWGGIVAGNLTASLRYHVRYL